MLCVAGSQQVGPEQGPGIEAAIGEQSVKPAVKKDSAEPKQGGHRCLERLEGKILGEAGKAKRFPPAILSPSPTLATCCGHLASCQGQQSDHRRRELELCHILSFHAENHSWLGGFHEKEVDTGSGGYVSNHSRLVRK
ncbi:hypothetical protein H920_11168 [Fukomys damarensis]|uniref:Uncharacterized protein n=1 Tax=Fukomys damarensis TaxID=885580 RepID=A0A091D5N9_FUKDA|nr:hypothetical protein H920_11168 [Fukomys damarensis]